MKNTYDNSSEAEFISKLKLLEIPPPDRLWDDIESTLKAKRRRKTISVTSWASAATIALLLSIYGVYEISYSVKKLSSNKPANEAVSNLKIKRGGSETLVKDFEKKETKKNRTLDNKKRDQPFFSSTTSSTLIFEDAKRDDEILEKIKSISPSLNNPEIAKPNTLRLNGYTNAANIRYIASVATDEKRAKGDWCFSVSGFPVYSFHTAGALHRNGTKQEVGIVSWGGAISAIYSFSNNFSIETGIGINTMGQEEKNIYLVSTDPNKNDVISYNGVNNSYGQFDISNIEYQTMDLDRYNDYTTNSIYQSNFNKANVLQRFRYLEISLLFAKGYRIKSKKVNIKAGLSANFLIGNRLDLKSESLHFKGKTVGVDRFSPSALASIGLTIPIAKYANLLIEPTFKLGLKSLAVESGKSYPFSTYIKLGIEIPF